MSEVSNNWEPRELEDALHGKTMILNMGPAHPATHGTVRLICELDGERIERCDVDVGYLHRGFEKQCENCDYTQVIPYTDRLNYVSPIINNVGYCIAIEKLFGVQVPERCEYVRVIVSELSRMCDHLTCVGAASMELGAFTVMLYLMQAREYLYELIEQVTGARLTISYVRVGGLRDDLPENFKEEVLKRFDKIKVHLDDSDTLLSKNRIFADRMCDVGIIAPDEAVAYGLTGPLLRASGVNYDVRKAFPYSGYERFNFEVPLGRKGDNFDRFNVRLLEIYQSMSIVEQALKGLPDGPVNIDDTHIILPPKDEVYDSIEGMINQFEVVFRGVQPPAGDVYFACEGGNGELGFYAVSDGSGKPYRVHVRAPSFISMGIVGPLIEGHAVADVVPIFGMMNMIGGSVTDNGGFSERSIRELGSESNSSAPSDRAEKRIGDLIARYPHKKSAVMPALYLAQETYGWINGAAIDWVAERLSLPRSHVLEVATFYTMYYKRPVGKYHVQVCRTLSCALCGAKKITQQLRSRLRLKPLEVSADGMWSYEEVECLGSCGTAPMVQINDVYFENLNEESLDALLDRIGREQPDLRYSESRAELGTGLPDMSRSAVWESHLRK